jgi:hypothetical protein
MSLVEKIKTDYAVYCKSRADTLARELASEADSSLPGSRPDSPAAQVRAIDHASQRADKEHRQRLWADQARVAARDGLVRATEDDLRHIDWMMDPVIRSIRGEAFSKKFTTEQT